MTLALCIFFFAYLIRVSFFSLIGYLFKRYALDGLKEQMREQEKQKEVLRQACLALERERELISQAAHEQELVVARLHEHVRHWGERFSVIVAQREAEKQKLMHELARKTALQQEHLSADVIADQVFVHALIQARAELRVQFASESAGKAFMGDVMASIKNSALKRAKRAS